MLLEVFGPVLPLAAWLVLFWLHMLRHR